jgi:hypothetical protein
VGKFARSNQGAPMLIPSPDEGAAPNVRAGMPLRGKEERGPGPAQSVPVGLCEGGRKKASSWGPQTGGWASPVKARSPR